jgi:hypothetical protein
MRFWKKKKQQVEQAVDEVATATSELVEKTAIIGPTGVLLLLGAAAVGAAATYYVAKTRQKRSSVGESRSDQIKKAASVEAASSKSGKSV